MIKKPFRLAALTLCAVGVLLFSAGCPVTPPDPNEESTALFDEVWNTFDQKYSYFGHKGVDWDLVKEQYRPGFAVALTPDAFATQLNDMLSDELSDWHVWVKKADGAVLPHGEDYQMNAPAQLFDSYTANDAGYAKIGDNAIFHALTGFSKPASIPHIVITTLGPEMTAVTETQIQQLFAQYASAPGMIIDLRYNSGGDENNGKRIASRFSNQDTEYGSTRMRNGPDHDDFAPSVAHSFQPAPQAERFINPVVCLIGQKCMSSAEWLTLMMKTCPYVTLMGDATRGASGNPEEFTLSNGVKYSVSRWVATTFANWEFEDVGIAPDVEIAPAASFDATHDYVLETALARLE